LRTSQGDFSGKVTRLQPNASFGMPGKRFFLDTNALIALLKGDAGLLGLTGSAEWIGISIITVLEFSSFRGINKADQALLAEFAEAVTVVDVAHRDLALMNQIVQTRQTTRLKLPDAIIMASAALHHATVVTNDGQLLKLGEQDATYATQGF
jgi:tRNA(fMet)-specific endonuclease VapC